MEGTGMRNAHLLAIAPNATSSIICGGTSPSIEPIRANVYSHKTLSGTFQVRNRQLHNLFKTKWNCQKLYKKIMIMIIKIIKIQFGKVLANIRSVSHLSFN